MPKNRFFPTVKIRFLGYGQCRPNEKQYFLSYITASNSRETCSLGAFTEFITPERTSKMSRIISGRNHRFPPKSSIPQTILLHGHSVPDDVTKYHIPRSPSISKAGNSNICSRAGAVETDKGGSLGWHCYLAQK